MRCGDTSDAPTDTAGVSDDSLKDQVTAIKSPQEIITVLRCESNITETATPPQSTSTETYSEKKELRRNPYREKAPRVARGAAIGSNRKDAVGCNDLLRDAASAANETKTTQAGSSLTHQKHNSSQTRPSSHDLGVNAVCKRESQSSQTVQSPINTSTNTASGHSPRTVPSPNELVTNKELETKRQATSSPSANKDRFVSAPPAINSTMKAESDDSSKITKPAITQKVDQRPLIVPPQVNPFTNAEHSHESVIVNIPPEVYSGTNTKHSRQTIPPEVFSGTNTKHSRQTIPPEVYSGTNTEHSLHTIPSTVYLGTNTQNSRQTIPSTVYSGTNTDHSRQTIPHPVYSGTNTENMPQTIPSSVYPGTNTENCRQTIPSSVYPGTNTENSRQTMPSSVYPGTNMENCRQTIPSSVYPGTNTENSRQTMPSSVYPGTNTENSRQIIPSSVYPGTNTESCRQTIPSSVYPGTNTENSRQTMPSSVYPGTNTENCRQTIPSSVYPGTNTENCRQTIPSSVYPGTNTKKGRHTIPSTVYQSTNTENIVQTIPSLVYPGTNKENSRQTIPYVFYSGTNTDHSRQIVLPMVYSSTNTEPSRQTIPPVFYSVMNTEPSRQTTQPVVYSGTNTDHGRQIIPPVDYSGTNTERGHESQTEQSSNSSIESKTNSRQLPETAAVQTECCEAASKLRPTTRIPRQTWHSPVKKHTARNTTPLNNGIRLTPSGSTSVSDGQTQTNQRRRWKESDAKLALASIENRYAPAQNKKHECRALVNRKHGESLPCDANERMSRIPIRKTQIRPAIGSRRTTSSTDGLTKSDKTMQVNKLGASSRLISQRASSVPSANNTTLQDTSASVSQVYSWDASVDEWHVAAPGKVQSAKGSYLPMQSESDNSLASRSRRILPIPRFSGSEIAIRLKTDRGINVHWELGCRALQTKKSSETDQMFSLQGDSTYIQHKTKNEAQNTQTSSGQDQLCEYRHYSQSETTVSSKSEGEIVSKKSGVNTMTVLRTSGVDASNSLQKLDESSTVQQVSFVKVGMVSVSAKADRFQTVRWKTDNYDHNGRQCKPIQTSESETLVSSKPKPDVVQRRRHMRKSMDDAFVVKRSGDGVSVGKKCNSDAVVGWLPSQSQKSPQYKSTPDYDFQRRTGSEDGNVYNSYDDPVVEDTSVEGSPESRTPEINADRRLSIKDNKIQQLYEKNSSIRASSEEDSRMRKRSRTASSSTRKSEVDDKVRRNSGMEGASRQRENNACVGRRKSEEHSRLYHPPKLRRSQSEPIDTMDSKAHSPSSSCEDTVINRKSGDNKQVRRKSGQSGNNSQFRQKRNPEPLMQKKTANIRVRRKSTNDKLIQQNREKDKGIWRKCERWLSSVDMSVSKQSASSSSVSECDTEHGVEEMDTQIWRKSKKKGLGPDTSKKNSSSRRKSNTVSRVPRKSTQDDSSWETSEKRSPSRPKSNRVSHVPRKSTQEDPGQETSGKRSPSRPKLNKVSCIPRKSTRNNDNCRVQEKSTDKSSFRRKSDKNNGIRQNSRHGQSQSSGSDTSVSATSDGETDGGQTSGTDSPVVDTMKAEAVERKTNKRSRCRSTEPSQSDASISESDVQAETNSSVQMKSRHRASTRNTSTKHATTRCKRSKLKVDYIRTPNLETHLSSTSEGYDVDTQNDVSAVRETPEKGVSARRKERANDQRRHAWTSSPAAHALHSETDYSHADCQRSTNRNSTKDSTFKHKSRKAGAVQHRSRKDTADGRLDVHTTVRRKTNANSLVRRKPKEEPETVLVQTSESETYLTSISGGEESQDPANEDPPGKTSIGNALIPHKTDKLTMGEATASQRQSGKNKRNSQLFEHPWHISNTTEASDSEATYSSSSEDESDVRQGTGTNVRKQGRVRHNTVQPIAEHRHLESTCPRRGQLEKGSPCRLQSGNNIPGKRQLGKNNLLRKESSRRRQSGNNSPRRRQSGNNSPRRRQSGNNSPRRRQSGNNSPRRRQSGNNSPRRQQSGNNSPRRRQSGNNSPRRRQSGNNSPSRQHMQNESPRRRQSRIDSLIRQKTNIVSQSESGTADQSESEFQIFVRRKSVLKSPTRRSIVANSPREQTPQKDIFIGIKLEPKRSITPEHETPVLSNPNVDNKFRRKYEHYRRLQQKRGTASTRKMKETSKHLLKQELESNIPVRRFSQVDASSSSDSESSTSSKDEFEMILRRRSGDNPLRLSARPPPARQLLSSSPDTSTLETSLSGSSEHDVRVHIKSYGQHQVSPNMACSDFMLKKEVSERRKKSVSISPLRRVSTRLISPVKHCKGGSPERQTRLVSHKTSCLYSPLPHKSLHEVRPLRLDRGSTSQLTSDTQFDLSHAAANRVNVQITSESDASLSAAQRPVRVDALPRTTVGETSPSCKPERNIQSFGHQSAVQRIFGYSFLTTNVPPCDNTRSSESDSSLEDACPTGRTYRQTSARADSSTQAMTRHSALLRPNSDGGVARMSSSTSLVVLLLQRDNNTLASKSELSVSSCPDREHRHQRRSDTAGPHQPGCYGSAALVGARGEHNLHPCASLTFVHRQSVRVTSLAKSELHNMSRHSEPSFYASRMQQAKSSTTQKTSVSTETACVEQPSRESSNTRLDARESIDTGHGARLTPVASLDGSTVDVATITNGSTALADMHNETLSTTTKLGWLVAIVRCISPYCWLHYVITIVNAGFADWAHDREMALLRALRRRERRRWKRITVLDT